MCKLIFLDIDGVLNTHGFDSGAKSNSIHRDKVARLNRILIETGAKVVLSSAWRYLIHRGEMSLAGMDWLLRSHGMLADRLIGITREDTMIPDGSDVVPLKNERGHQIARWREENGHTGLYVVIDDIDLGITGAGHPFVLSNDVGGLCDGAADEAIAILNQEAAALRARADRHVDRAFEAAGDGCWHTERWHLARASRCYRKAATQVAGEERARLFDRAAWAAETGRFDPPEPLAPEPAAGQLAFILEDDDAR